MRISIPKILRRIDLADYAPELVHPDGKPILVWVWVNPPRDLMERRRAILQTGGDAIRRLKDAPAGGTDGQGLTLEERRRIVADLADTSTGISAWFAEIWSQGQDPETHWSAEDVLTVGKNSTDPALYVWLQNRTMELIEEHRSGEKKRPVTL